MFKVQKYFVLDICFLYKYTLCTCYWLTYFSSNFPILSTFSIEELLREKRLKDCMNRVTKPHQLSEYI